MSGLETAIRQALERSDRGSAETRARIYQSARNALEAGLRKQNIHDQAVISEQRHRLEVAIHAIEQQERAALVGRVDATVAPVVSQTVVSQTVIPQTVEPVRVDPPNRLASGRPDPVASLDDVGRRDADPRASRSVQAPSVDRDIEDRDIEDRDIERLRFDRRREDALGDDEGLDDEAVIVPARDRNRPGAGMRDRINDLGMPGAEPLVPRRTKRRGRLVSGLMVVAVIVAAVGSAAWWVVSTGLLERPGTAPAAPPVVTGEGFDGSAGLRTLGAQAGFSGDWIAVYDPADKIAVAPAARAKAELTSDEGGEYLSITSSAGDADGNVALDVPASVLERMAGQTSTVAVSVQSVSGKPTQFSVECDFASLGDCGRHRFTVNDEKSDMLFKVTFDRTLTPTAPGRILINSDVTGHGDGLNLYGIRLLPGR